MARADNGSKIIAKALTADGIPTPRQHYRLVKHGIPPEPKRWNEETVIQILRNRVYLGDMVQGKYDCPRFKRTPPKRKPKEEWLITVGTHEPLVDKDTWDFVQKQIDARHRPRKNNEIQLFSGFVKCEDCGRALTLSLGKSYPYYSCSEYRRHGREACSSHYIRKDVLEQAVFDDIRKYAKLAKHEEDKLTRQLHEQSGEKDASHIKDLSSELKKLTARDGELDRILKRLYEDRVSGEISDDMFRKLLAEYEQEQSDVQAKIADTEQKIEDTKANHKDTASWIKLIQNYIRIKELDRAVLCELVDKIVVSATKKIDGNKVSDITIHYRFVGTIS